MSPKSEDTNLDTSSRPEPGMTSQRRQMRASERDPNFYVPEGEQDEEDGESGESGSGGVNFNKTNAGFDPAAAKARQEPEQAHAEESDEDASFNDPEEGNDEEDGSQSGTSGGGGGVKFDETEVDFDPAEVQGMQIPKFRQMLKKGLKLIKRISAQSEQYLKNFLPEKDLRDRVIELTLSKKGHPTLVLDKGEIVQYQLERGKLERVRVSPDLEARQAVRYAMAGFKATGQSIDPKDIKFGRSAEFEARMKPIWVQEWTRMQVEGKGQKITPKRNPNFRKAVQTTLNQRDTPKPAAQAQAKTAPYLDIARNSPKQRVEPTL